MCRDAWGFPLNPERAGEALALARFLELRSEARALFFATYGPDIREP